MSKSVSSGLGRPKLVAAALAATLLAGCSGDALRLSDPFGSRSADAIQTGTVRARSAEAPPVDTVTAAPTYDTRVASAPLAAPSRPAASAPLTAQRPGAAVNPPVTGNGAGAWVAQGGSSVTLGAGESLETISQRYGVPTSALISANGLRSASDATPGRTLVIPVYNASAKPAAERPEPARVASPGPVTARPKVEAAPTVRPLVRPPAPQQSAKPVAPAAMARATPIATPKPAAPKLAEVRAADPRAPLTNAPSTAALRAPGPVATKPATVAAPAPAEPARTAAKPAPRPEPEAPVQTAAIPPAPPAAPAAAPPPAGEFRWPARGRIINGFTGPGGNDGINIAVPEGTPVKAAEGGTVAYAGSELKGYGNLVLIRHPNGWVSAYAHNGELTVKRGEVVKRGQVVAKSGKTGNVTTPQLHFELRRGSTPVDPTLHLAGN